MALADIRQRPGILLGAAIVIHILLISAQVTTASGLPVIQVGDLRRLRGGAAADDGR